MKNKPRQHLGAALRYRYRGVLCAHSYLRLSRAGVARQAAKIRQKWRENGGGNQWLAAIRRQ
jgi:hypothetical protein